MDLGLNGKRAIVAAASDGLGAAIAMTLAAEGCTVELCSRSSDRAAAKAAEIADATGASVRGVAVDVADADAVTAWVDEAAARMGGLDIVIPNAGGPRPGSFDDTTSEDWDASYALTLRSAMVFAKASRRHLTDGGTVLFTTSLSTLQPMPDLSMSGVFRAGVANLSKNLADTWARDGIRVNHLVPGRIATARVAELDAVAAERTGRSISEVEERNAVSIPLGRYGDVDEYAAAAAFLVSPRASYITGATLVVDGGSLRSIT